MDTDDKERNTNGHTDDKEKPMDIQMAKRNTNGHTDDKEKHQWIYR